MTEAKVNWNPADYAANSASQQAWARDLFQRLNLQGGETILDVGCGDGKVTADLARMVGCNGSVVGIDASAEMIAYAQRQFAPDRVANLTFRVMDARRIEFSSQFDIVFSNAALHWVDDHREFLRGAALVLKEGGRLLISCGGKGNAQDVFVLLRSAMRTHRWRPYFRNLRKPYYFHSPEEYDRWLPKHGFKTGTARLVPKDMAFPNRERFAGWVRTTWLPYTQRVPEPLREEFIAELVGRYEAQHPADASGSIHVRMVRLEIDATR